MDNFDSLMEQLTGLDKAQLGTLITRLEDKWGVSATPVISAPQTPVVVESVKAEPTEFSVFLAGFTADKKMSIIKLIRELTGAGLLQAKEFVERPLPQEVKTGLTRDEADEIKRKLDEAGGSVEVKPVV